MTCSPQARCPRVLVANSLVKTGPQHAFLSQRKKPLAVFSDFWIGEEFSVVTLNSMRNTNYIVDFKIKDTNTKYNYLLDFKMNNFGIGIRVMT